MDTMDFLGTAATTYKKMYVVHAEANAILHSNGTRLTGTCLYTTLFPCNECTKLIIQSGISKVLYLSDKYCEKDSVKASRKMLQLAGVEVIRHVPQQAQININFAEILNEDPSYLGSN
ncbi:hypothetical protein KR026_000723 [Drosophila bipectinata]|nr:hypothetical protein KR026_000723 [Drosophila bipectinata]